MNTDYYVYVIKRPDGRPAYVGKGRKQRASIHAKRSHNKHLANIYAQAGGKLPIIKSNACLTSEEASELESLLIADIGREDLGAGPLVNRTDGGEGTVGFRAPKSPEHRKKIGDANRGSKRGTETRRKISIALTGKKRSPEAIEKSAAALRGRKRPGWPNADTKARISVGNIGRIHSLETRAKMSASGRGRPKSMQHRAKISEALSTPEEKSARSALSKAWYAALTDEQRTILRAQRSASTTAYWARRKAK